MHAVFLNMCYFYLQFLIFDGFIFEKRFLIGGAGMHQPTTTGIWARHVLATTAVLARQSASSKMPSLHIPLSGLELCICIFF